MMPLSGRGGRSGGPRYGWGDVRGAPGAGGGGSRHDAQSGWVRGRHAAGPEPKLRRNEWQWRGHGPSAMRDYGWDYRGGVGRDEIAMRSEASGGGGYLSRMAQDRGGGVPRYAGDFDVGRGFGRPGEGRYARDYDAGYRGVAGERYGADYGARRGGGERFAAPEAARGGYGREYRRLPIRGAAFGGEYSVEELARGRAGRRGHARDYGEPPLSDEEFRRRVERW